MKALPEEESNEDGEEVEEDLYETSRKVQPKCSQKLMTYEIR